MKKILICILITFLSSSYLFSQQSISYNASFSTCCLNKLGSWLIKGQVL